MQTYNKGDTKGRDYLGQKMQKSKKKDQAAGGMKMKKMLSVITVGIVVFSLAGCGNTVSEPVPEEGAGGSETEPVAADDSNALVVYFSWSGNTENVAKAIAEQTGADVFEIVPEEAYIEDYNALLDIAAEEKESGARPAIAGSIEDIAQYDIIYVGFPNWWSDMPMILYTFFDTYDLSGKTIAPFCTSGGSGLSNTVNSIKELEPDADVLEGLHIGSSSASDPGNAVSDWLGRLDLAE